MTEKCKLRWIYCISAIFIVLNTILIANEFYWLSLVPAVLFILLLYFFSLDKLIFLIVLLTPLAINIENLNMNFAISIPTEPLMFGVMLLFFIKLFYKNDFDIKIIKHPVTIAIIIYFLWLLITSFTSEMPLISLKYILARLWFIVCFYLIGTQMFKKYKNIKLFPWFYVIPLTGIIIYTTYNHSLYDFGNHSAHWVMTPFYNDHTAYGSAISFFIPVFLFFSFNKKYTKTIKILSFIILLMLIFAVILSYSRAAWISLIIALLIYFIVLLKINFKWLLLALAIFIGLFFIFQNKIIIGLEKNKQESSSKFIENIQSVSNITSDASNLERINRWECAFRMFSERPVFGWGPGTYQFLYAPFQRTKEKTIISTNVGNRGNAHSEYIGPLAESGILGMLTVLCIVICVIYTGIKVYKNTKDKETKLLSLSFSLGLITYFVHGMMNNFLDTDKSSVPFWGFIAIIVALDVYHKEKTDIEKPT